MKVQMKQVALAALIGGTVFAAAPAFAAEDVLTLPTPQYMNVLTEAQEQITVEVPSPELKRVVQDFNAYTETDKDQLFVLTSNQVVRSSELEVKKLMNYMEIRKNFYIRMHRWNKDSYGTERLNELYDAYANYFESQGDTVIVNGEKLETELLDILQDKAKDVYNDELRSYMNEIVLFGLQQTMKSNNGLAKPYTDKELPKEALEAYEPIQLLK